MKTRYIYWCLLLPMLVCGQAKKLPTLNPNRSTNIAYIDSLISIGHQNLRTVSALPSSFVNDSIQLEGWSYLAFMFRYRAGQRDSVLYYTGRMMEKARLYQQPVFVLRGLHYQILYYQVTLSNYPKTLQLCHQALTLIDQNPSLQYESWRFHTAMGEIFIAVEQFPKALQALQAAKTALENTNYLQINRFSYANILQQIGNVCKHTNHFDEGKKYLLQSLDLIKPTKSSGSLYYIYLDLCDLYRINGYPQEALKYALEAEKEANQSKNHLRLMNTWAWLARVHSDLKNYDLAIEYGLKSVQHGASSLTLRIGHHSLYRAYQAKQQWQNSLMHYEKHISVSDTMRAKRQINESVAIQNQFELDQLALQSRQAQELQAQKMLAFQKQTEIDRLRAKATTDQLRAEAQQTALQNQLQTEALKTQAQKTQQAQQAQINSLKISELDKQLTLENRTRNFLVGGITFLFLVGIVLLKLNSKLKSQNAQLAAKNREITEALLKGQTTERKRVAAELHDNLGGLLGALKMTTNVLDASTLHPQEQEIYGQIVKMIDEANVQIRSLSHNMLPEQLEKQGLVASLETLVSKLNLGQKTKFNLVASGLLQRLPKQTEFNLYTIVLELCNNILKHANATEALIELHQKNDALHLLVTDNGSGFDTQSSTEGMGFQNLKERANATGGDLKIRSLKGEGTVISLKISQPVRAESRTI